MAKTVPSTGGPNPGTAEHAGRRLNVTVCQLMRIQDGKIVEVRGHYSGEAALDAFWGTSSSAAR
jgi:ketosteroid isomerase-like protein